MARAAVCVDPVQAGAGMQNKLLEYLAMGKAVVATTVANEGIGATPGEHLVIADSPGDIADGIVKLCEDAGRRAAFGEAARGFIETRWTWEAQFLDLEQSIYAALDETCGAGPGEERKLPAQEAT